MLIYKCVAKLDRIDDLKEAVGFVMGGGDQMGDDLIMRLELLISGNNIKLETPALFCRVFELQRK
jgi:hypothetical protein